MAGEVDVLSQFRPNNELGPNFDRIARKLLNELRLDIEQGHFDIARGLVANIGGVFAQVLPGKSAEIQAALIALIDSQMQPAPVEQPKVIGSVEPVVSGENQVTPVEVAPPLKQVSEAEASPQIAACITIEQVVELIKEWEIPVSPGKLDDGTEVAREPVPGYLAVARMKTLVDSIIQATNDQLDEVIKTKQNLLPRFAGLRDKVIALARAERIKTMKSPLNPARDEVEEAEPEVPELKVAPDAISFGAMFNNHVDMMAVARKAGIAPTSVLFMEKYRQVPTTEIDDESTDLIQALANRAIAIMVLDPLRQRCVEASREQAQHGKAYEKAASELSYTLAQWTNSMLRGERPNDSSIRVAYPNETEPEKARDQALLLIDRIAKDLRPFVVFSANNFSLTATLRAVRAVSTDSFSNVTPL